MQIRASVGTGPEGRSQRDPRTPDTTAPAKPGLPALVAADVRPLPERRPQARPLAAVVAQLAAGAGDHPATRARRRAEASEGASLYGLAAAVTPPARKTTIRIL